MQIKRDYTQPFFRERKPKRLKYLVYAVIAGLLIGLALLTQAAPIEHMIDSMTGNLPTPTPLPSQLATDASELIAAGNLEGASKLLEKVVAERPENVAYLYEYGNLLIDIERAGEAFDLGRKITDLNPRDVRGYALQARSLVWQGQPSTAIPIALSGLDLDSNFTVLHEVLTRAYVDTDRWGEGLDMAERGLDINPNDANLLRAYAYALQSVASYEQAISYLESSIELRPSFLPTYFELAGLYLAQERDQDAIALYDRILAIEPRNSRALLRQCLAYRKVGEFQRALGFCEDAVSNDPADPEALFQLGLLYYRERQFDLSQDAFSECLKYDTGVYDLSCMYRLGLSHYYTGECATGWDLLQDSLVIAQARDETEAAIDNIRQGLNAIANDPLCPGYSGRSPITPIPEETQEAMIDEGG